MTTDGSLKAVSRSWLSAYASARRERRLLLNHGRIGQGFHFPVTLVWRSPGQQSDQIAFRGVEANVNRGIDSRRAGVAAGDDVRPLDEAELAFGVLD